MLLAGDTEAAWNNCHKQVGKSLINWWGQFNGVLTELSLIGVNKEDAEKTAKATYMIGDEYATLAELLGWKEDMRQYGVARDQRLADATSIRRNVQQHNDQHSEGTFAVTTRQAFRGSGFSARGRGGRFNNAGRSNQG